MRKIEIEDIDPSDIDEVMRRLRWDDYTDTAMRERIARYLLVGSLYWVTKKNTGRAIPR